MLAIQVLNPWISDSEVGSTVKAEIVRVHLVQGDRKSASNLLGDVITSESTSPSQHDLLIIQAAFVQVATCGDLSGALQIASSMWLKYGNEAAIMDEDDSIVSLPLYQIWVDANSNQGSNWILLSGDLRFVEALWRGPYEA